MAEEKGMGLVRSFWRWTSGSKIPMDLMGLPILGLVAFLLFRHASALAPVEGAFLIMVTAGLVQAGLRWWDWQRGLASDGSLMDWVQRTLGGERKPMSVPAGLREQDDRMAEALNAALQDVQAGRSELRDLQKAMNRDWAELDAVLASLQQLHAAEEEQRSHGAARLTVLGKELKTAIEDTLRLDQIELNYRLRADQFRLQGQAFRSTVDQLREGLDHFENLLEELQDTFPRLRREEDALGRLADAGLRQGARLSLSIKGLVAHTPRLVDETQARTEGLRRLRHSADGVRDQTEALARRIESFREEAQARIRSFGGAQGTLKELDHVAQQTGLLAVNAAILAQQEGGSTGMAAIGGRLRFLADQTADGASGMERTLNEYQLGLERETANLWDLQEVTQKLIADVHELLRTVGNMDHQGHDLERALETHMGLVDQARQSSERAELSLHEIGARSMALETALARQWGVEAKITPQRERLSRMGLRLTEVGGELARISQQNIDEIWDILGRHQEIRRSEAYRQVTSGDLHRLVEVPADPKNTWNGIAWARAERRFRTVERDPANSPPIGRRDTHGNLRLQLLGQDALHRPEPSAVEAWGCDVNGQVWNLHLLGSLRTESHRLGLLAVLKESPLALCLHGVDIRISSEGAQIRLPHPYPAMVSFLAGLRLELPVAPELWDHPFREDGRKPVETQGLVWIGPGQGGGVQSPCMRLIHAWVRDDHRHEAFLPWLPFEGHRKPCPWLGDTEGEEALPGPMSIRCLGLDGDPATLHPIRDRLFAAGAVEASGGATLCSIGIGHLHPESLLLRLFQPEADLAGAFHPDLVPYQARLRDEVLGGATGDPYSAAWSLLEDLHREGWLLPLPPS